MKTLEEVKQWLSQHKSFAAIKQFTANIEYEAFSQNLEKVFAVSRAIEIIGEAVKRIPDSVRNQYPDIPW